MRGRVRHTIDPAARSRCPGSKRRTTTDEMDRIKWGRPLPIQTMRPEVNDLRIDPQDAARKVAAGEAFLLDVVTEGSWRSLPRVPKGALRIPPEDLIARLDEIPRDRA